jgi:hypothetical protein
MTSPRFWNLRRISTIAFMCPNPVSYNGKGFGFPLGFMIKGNFVDRVSHSFLFVSSVNH